MSNSNPIPGTPQPPPQPRPPSGPSQPPPPFPPVAPKPPASSAPLPPPFPGLGSPPVVPGAPATTTSGPSDAGEAAIPPAWEAILGPSATPQQLNECINLILKNLSYQCTKDLKKAREAAKHLRKIEEGKDDDS